MARPIAILTLAAAALVAAACIPSLPSDTQAGGAAPLVTDLDLAGTPFMIAAGDTAQEVTVSVRGPDKGKNERGGITGSFTAVGGQYCIIVDPANVWEGPNAAQDSALDDGDTDLYVGRAADYTGSPGSTIGDFKADYVDKLGVPHEIDENLCVQSDLNGLPGGHAGAGTLEFCTIETQAGVPYIVKSDTISVPVIGGVLKVAMRVSTGPCGTGDFTPTENTLTGDN